ncbi:MAG: hypothetical protein ACTS4U_01160 [Candidatus Hodgkinia cicadicola]
MLLRAAFRGDFFESQSVYISSSEEVAREGRPFVGICLIMSCVPAQLSEAKAIYVSAYFGNV